MKKKVVKQETVTKTPKTEKDARAKEAGSKRRKMEVNTPQREKRSTARRRKSSSAEQTAAGELMVFHQSETSFSSGVELTEFQFNCHPCCRSTKAEWKSNKTEQQIKTNGGTTVLDCFNGFFF